MQKPKQIRSKGGGGSGQAPENTCVDCGRPFQIAAKEIDRFKEKKIPLPTRCRVCRRSKLIENKLKRLTKVIFQIYALLKAKDEPKLQKKSKERKQTPKGAGK